MSSSADTDRDHARTLALKGSNMTSTKSNNTRPKDNLVEKTLRPKAASHIGRTSHVQNSNNLVLQMYSHVRVQRQLEQEREIKISRTERKRQKLKKQLEVASSNPSSRDGFCPKWTEARSGYGPLGQRQQSGSQLGLDASKTVTNHLIPCGDDSSSDNDRVQNSTADATTKTIVGTNTTDDQITASDTVRSPDVNTTVPQNTHRLNVESFQNNRHNGGAFHVIKGPGRVQIKFAPSNSRPSSKADPRRSKQYQWDNMPAGTLLSAHMPVVTIDSKVL